jgi:hypothetical protein
MGEGDIVSTQRLEKKKIETVIEEEVEKKVVKIVRLTLPKLKTRSRWYLSTSVNARTAA